MVLFCLRLLHYTLQPGLHECKTTKSVQSVCDPKANKTSISIALTHSMGLMFHAHLRVLPDLKKESITCYNFCEDDGDGRPSQVLNKHLH